MNIQSASIVIPTHNHCVNKCPFCVSRTHCNLYQDRISKSREFQWFKEHGVIPMAKRSIEFQDYFKRLQFTRDNGCNVAVLTGTGEPPQNIPFIDFFMKINESLKTPFENVEVQTTGVLLTDEILAHFRQIGIQTIAFSISNIFNNERNLELIDCHEKLRFDLEELIALVKKHEFNLRLSLNLINDYDRCSVPEVLDRCKSLGADQVTFRKLYTSGNDTEIDQWINDNSSREFYDKLVNYIVGSKIPMMDRFNNFRMIGILPFGAKIWDVDEMSVVIDDDCMNEEVKDIYKYIILRENAKLYSKWETKASLIF